MSATQASNVQAALITNDPDAPSPFDPIVQHKPRMFLVALSDVGNIVQAAKLSGCSRQAVYHWRKTDPNFERAFQVAWELGLEALEAACHERATRASFPSDQLAQFLLKGGMRWRYGDRSAVELSGPNGKPVQFDYSRLSDEELATIERLCAKAAKPAEIEAPTVDVSSSPVEPEQ